MPGDAVCSPIVDRLYDTGSQVMPPGAPSRTQSAAPWSCGSERSEAMRYLGSAILVAAASAALLGGGACGGGSSGTGGGGGTGGAGGAGGTAPKLTTEELMDPQACATCHPDHVKGGPAACTPTPRRTRSSWR